MTNETISLSEDQITGQSCEHIVQNLPAGIACGVHWAMVGDFLQLQADAWAAGFELAIASGFRDFERQLSIWNRKVKGELPVLDAQGQPLNIKELSPVELVHAILRWSALPGASRHHWGTDIDVYDASAVLPTYRVQLVDDEFYNDGPFMALHDWLDERIETNKSYGFFRPYAKDRGGVAPERWHLSYAPLSKNYQQQVSSELLSSVLQKVDIELEEAILENIDAIYQRYIVIPFDDYPQ